MNAIRDFIGNCCVPPSDRSADGGNLNRTRRVKVPLLIKPASFWSSWLRLSALGRFGFAHPHPLTGCMGGPPPPPQQ
jgi:hypothetical protein